jgi:hypothetical protein
VYLQTKAEGVEEAESQLQDMIKSKAQILAKTTSVVLSPV